MLSRHCVQGITDEVISSIINSRVAPKLEQENSVITSQLLDDVCDQDVIDKDDKEKTQKLLTERPAKTVLSKPSTQTTMSTSASASSVAGSQTVAEKRFRTWVPSHLLSGF